MTTAVAAATTVTLPQFLVYFTKKNITVSALCC